MNELIQSGTEKMAEQLIAQKRRLQYLEQTLQKEREDKANLEADFQHVLDQLQSIAV